MQEDTESKQIHQEEERIKAEKKGLEEDLEKFEQRPKPPWYGMSETSQKAMQGYVPLSDEIRMKLYEIQQLPSNQRGLAYGDYFKKAPQQVQEILQMNAHVDQYQTRITDISTGEEFIVRDDSEQKEE
jgi:hypothetical protein